MKKPDDRPLYICFAFCDPGAFDGTETCTGVRTRASDNPPPMTDIRLYLWRIRQINKKADIRWAERNLTYIRAPVPPKSIDIGWRICSVTSMILLQLQLLQNYHFL